MAKEDNEAAASDSVSSSNKRVNKDAEKAKKAADTITDFVREKEGDLKKAAAAISTLVDSTTSKKKDELMFEGNIRDDDVLVIKDECDLSKELAERLLRKNEGDVKKAMLAYLRDHE